MTQNEFERAIATLRKEFPTWEAPAKQFDDCSSRTPFDILVSVILSFRTRDETTRQASHRLLAIAHTPATMADLPVATIEKAIYPVGFWRKKARTIHAVCQTLLQEYGGEVPDDASALLALPGIGPKAAAIVLERAFGHAVVAADTHVHRILNLWGYLETATPEATQALLNERLDDDLKRGLNRLLVAFGQAICRPRHPRCDACALASSCRNFQKA